MIQNSKEAWILAARPKTLVGAVAPVLIGGILGFSHLTPRIGSTSAIGWWFQAIAPFILCMLFALIMQIDANFINDYTDWRKGSDRSDRLGPERAMAQGWITPNAMRLGILITTIAAILVGLPLLFFGGMWMILVAVVCIVACILYSTFMSYKGWGDALVVVFFGIVPVVFTYWCVVKGSWSAAVNNNFLTHMEVVIKLQKALLLGFAMGLVTDCLLMVNNYRDVEQDRVSGKQTLVVRFGEKLALQIYLWAGVVAIVLVLLVSWKSAVLLLVYLVLHIITFYKMSRRKGRDLNSVLGMTARNIIVFGACTALGLII